MISIDELPPHLPSLLPFRPDAPASENARRRAGRSVIESLQIVRDEIQADNVPTPILDLVDEVIKNLDTWARFTDPELDEIVLFCIEEKFLYLTTEIADELVVSRELVVAVLDRLVTSGRVYRVRRFVPMSGRPQFMYKSSRVANVEHKSVGRTLYSNYSNPDAFARNKARA